MSSAFNFKQLVNSLQEMVQCSICFDTLNEPRQLHCGHTFCLNCLIGWSGKYGNSFKCPNCRNPERYTVESLPRDYQCLAIMDLVDKYTRLIHEDGSRNLGNNEFEGSDWKQSADKQLDSSSSHSAGDTVDELKHLLKESKLTWEQRFMEIITRKRTVLHQLNKHVGSLEHHVALWKLKTASFIEDFFKQEVLKVHLEFLTELNQTERALGSHVTSRHLSDNIKEKLSEIQSLINTSRRKSAVENIFYFNSLDTAGLSQMLDQLSGMSTLQRTHASTQEEEFRGTLALAGRFLIARNTGERCRITDARLLDGVLYVSDILNSCVYAVNSWTGSIINSTRNFSFQHSILFPQTISVSSTGQVHVTEVTSSRQLNSVLDAQLSSKQSINTNSANLAEDARDHRKPLVRVNAKGTFEVVTMEPCRQKEKEDFQEDGSNMYSEDFAKSVLLYTHKNWTVNWVFESESSLAGTSFQSSKVLYINKTERYHWLQDLDEFCGPRSVDMDACGENLIVCCSTANHLHKLSKSGAVLQLFSLQSLGISRPISCALRDNNHLIVVEQMGAVSTVKIIR